MQLKEVGEPVGTFGLYCIQLSLPCRIKEGLLQNGLTNNPRFTLE
jgi:hypothetical protein